jgi:hypothetical protein
LPEDEQSEVIARSSNTLFDHATSQIESKFRVLAKATDKRAGARKTKHLPTRHDERLITSSRAPHLRAEDETDASPTLDCNLDGIDGSPRKVTAQLPDATDALVNDAQS